MKKSVGPNGISAKFLKEIAGEISGPLTKLFNKSLETDVLPSEWKRRDVTPVFKSGSKDNRCNLHPISVVPIVAKILVAQQLSSFFFGSHQLLSPFQCVYQKKKSTEQLLLVAVDGIVSALDKKLCACMAFSDRPLILLTISY